MPELLEARAAALYRMDAAGDLIESNSRWTRPAPSVAVTIGAERTLLEFGAQFPHPQRAAVTDAVEYMIQRDWATTEIPAGVVEALRLLVAGREPVAEEHHGPLFAFPDELPPVADTVAVTPTSVERMLRMFPQANGEAIESLLPFRAILDGEQAVSACYSARRGAFVHEAGVDTLPELRCHGLGARVCVAWAADVRSLGAVPVYSTSFDNHASCALARRLRLVRLATDLHFTLTSG
jgi:hypothetical protein